ncbi:MarR family transcriptional regulator [Thermomonospora cellulosilytica]|uniref:MarR family transcriptional regulator n=1 Tax=Thermomonospora cellulosilytica TaxID=1411118 RepID=UPI001C72123E
MPFDGLPAVLVVTVAATTLAVPIFASDETVQVSRFFAPQPLFNGTRRSPPWRMWRYVTGSRQHQGWLHRRTMSADAHELQDAVARFVRSFGLLQPDRTPCGRPIPPSEAHALGELARAGELRQVDLVCRLRLEKSTTSRLVGQLVSRGWVVRAPAFAGCSCGRRPARAAGAHDTGDLQTARDDPLRAAQAT